MKQVVWGVMLLEHVQEPPLLKSQRSGCLELFEMHLPSGFDSENYKIRRDWLEKAQV